MYALGIETSCDETSVGIVFKNKVLANVTVSSLRYHKKYGGIVPEIAHRNHLRFIEKVTDIALKKAGIDFSKIKVIGVSFRPGLVGALLVGVSFAKGLSLALNIPFLGINHLHAHLFSPFLNKTLLPSAISSANLSPSKRSCTFFHLFKNHSPYPHITGFGKIQLKYSDLYDRP